MHRRIFGLKAASLPPFHSICLRLILSCVVAAPAFAAPAIQNKALKVTEIAPGVFVYHGAYEIAAPVNGGAIANLGFIIGRDAVAVIDSGGTAQQGQRLKAAVRARTDKPIRYVINTHMHPDHVLGNAAFTGEAEFVGHAKLKRALQARGAYYIDRAREIIGHDALEGTSVVLPTVEIEGTRTLDLGDRPLTLTAHPTAHTDNDLTVRDEKTGTLFLGDLLFVRHVPALDGSLKGWLAVMRDLSAQPALRAVPGHGPPSVDWPAALKPQHRYLNRLLEGVREKIASGMRISDAARSVGLDEKDLWALFDDYHARNVSAAYAELEWE